MKVVPAPIPVLAVLRTMICLGRDVTRCYRSMSRDVTDQQSRSMQNNVLFHQVPEDKDENCEDKVKKLLQNWKYPGELSVERVHSYLLSVPLRTNHGLL